MSGVAEPTAEQLDAITDEDIEAGIALDPDAGPILSEAQLAAGMALLEKQDRYGVFALRRRLHISQVVFASRYRVRLSTLRQWEQGVREPDAAAKLLLAVIAAEPELVARVAAQAA